MFLKCVERDANCYIKFYPIVTKEDKERIDKLISERHEIYVGLSENKKHGEGFEICNIQ